MIAPSMKQQLNRAVQLFGAADKILEREGLSGLSQHILYPGMIEEGIHAAHQQLDEEDFEREWEKCHKMTLEQVVTFAVRDSE